MNTINVNGKKVEMRTMVAALNSTLTGTVNGSMNNLQYARSKLGLSDYICTSYVDVLLLYCYSCPTLLLPTQYNLGVLYQIHSKLEAVLSRRSAADITFLNTKGLIGEALAYVAFVLYKKGVLTVERGKICKRYGQPGSKANLKVDITYGLNNDRLEGVRITDPSLSVVSLGITKDQADTTWATLTPFFNINAHTLKSSPRDAYERKLWNALSSLEHDGDDTEDGDVLIDLHGKIVKVVGANFEVERIVAKHTNEQGQLEYLVKWTNFCEAANSWVAASDCSDCSEAFTKFENEVNSCTRGFSNAVYGGGVFIIPHRLGQCFWQATVLATQDVAATSFDLLALALKRWTSMLVSQGYTPSMASFFLGSLRVTNTSNTQGPGLTVTRTALQLGGKGFDVTRMTPKMAFDEPFGFKFTKNDTKRKRNFTQNGSFPWLHFLKQCGSGRFVAVGVAKPKTSKRKKRGGHINNHLKHAVAVLCDKRMIIDLARKPCKMSFVHDAFGQVFVQNGQIHKLFVIRKYGEIFYPDTIEQH
jgi:hypothetical protein